MAKRVNPKPLERIANYTVHFEFDSWLGENSNDDPINHTTHVLGQIMHLDDDGSTQVGEIDLRLCDLAGAADGGWSYFDVMDSVQCISDYLPLFEPNSVELKRSVGARLDGDPILKLLVLDKISIPNSKDRGFGLGLAVIRETMIQFADEFTLSVGKPTPQYGKKFGFPKGQIRIGKKKLTDYYARLGFVPLGAGLIGFHSSRRMPTMSEIFKKVKSREVRVRRSWPRPQQTPSAPPVSDPGVSVPPGGSRTSGAS